MAVHNYYYYYYHLSIVLVARVTAIAAVALVRMTSPLDWQSAGALSHGLAGAVAAVVVVDYCC